MQKQRKTNGFSTFAAKYCKNHRFYNVFEHFGCKNKGKPIVFQHFQQNIAKTTGFIRFLSICDAKTKENQWFHIVGQWTFLITDTLYGIFDN